METATTPEAEAPRLPHLDYTGDALHSLRVPELRVANATLSRTLGRSVDVLHSVMDPTEDRWDAMAHIGWILHKRQDPTAQLGLWTHATAAELSQALRPRPVATLPEPPDDDDQPEPANLTELAKEAAVDPTGTSGSPSSPPPGEG